MEQLCFQLYLLSTDSRAATAWGSTLVNNKRKVLAKYLSLVLLSIIESQAYFPSFLFNCDHSHASASGLGK